MRALGVTFSFLQRMSKGIYCLVVHLDSPKSIRIGALGSKDFLAGYYLYVGSALGGLSRLDRHFRFSKEHYTRPKWHIDYLDFEAPILYAYYAETESRLECSLAAAIGGDSVNGFGCSDCSCVSHLFYRTSDPSKEIVKAFLSLGLTAYRKDA